MSILLRLRNRLESNFPVIFYSAMIAYTNILEGRVHPAVTYLGLGLSLLLRFEFMNQTLINLAKSLDLCVLGFILYQCVAMVLRW